MVDGGHAERQIDMLDSWYSWTELDVADKAGDGYHDGEEHGTWMDGGLAEVMQA